MTYLKKCLTVATLTLLSVGTPLAKASNPDISRYECKLIVREGETFRGLLTADQQEVVVELRRLPVVNDYSRTGYHPKKGVVREVPEWVEMLQAFMPARWRFPDASAFFEAPSIAQEFQECKQRQQTLVSQLSDNVIPQPEKLVKVTSDYQEVRVWPYIKGVGWLHPRYFAQALSSKTSKSGRGLCRLEPVIKFMDAPTA